MTKFTQTFAVILVTTILACSSASAMKKEHHNSKKSTETVYIILNHKVNDYASWLKIYDTHKKAHEKSALEEVNMYQDVNDPNDITIIFKTKDLAKAQNALNGPGSDKMYKESGVVNKPTIYFTHKLK